MGSPPALRVKVEQHSARRVEPCRKVTVPVAGKASMSDSTKVAWAPKVMVAEVEPLTVVEKVVGAPLTVRATVLVPEAPEKLPSVSTKVAVTVG